MGGVGPRDRPVPAVPPVPLLFPLPVPAVPVTAPLPVPAALPLPVPLVPAEPVTRPFVPALPALPVCPAVPAVAPPPTVPAVEPVPAPVPAVSPVPVGSVPDRDGGAQASSQPPSDAVSKVTRTALCDRGRSLGIGKIRATPSPRQVIKLRGRPRVKLFHFPEKASAPKLTTLASSMFHCSYER